MDRPARPTPPRRKSRRPAISGRASSLTPGPPSIELNQLAPRKPSHPRTIFRPVVPPPTPIPDDYRRALGLLADAPDGCTEAIMLAHGIDRELIVELVRDGFTNGHKEVVHSGMRTLRVMRLHITETGHRVLAILEGKSQRRS